MKSEVDAAQALSDAANLIERNGLHKGDYWPGAADEVDYSTGSPCCVRGAIRVAAGFRSRPMFGEPRPETVRAAELLLGDYLHRWSVPLAWWNDRPERTAGQVVSALRSAASKMAARRGGA